MKSRSCLLRPPPKKKKSPPSRKCRHFLNLVPLITENVPASWIICSLAGRINKWILAEALRDQFCTEGHCVQEGTFIFIIRMNKTFAISAPPHPPNPTAEPAPFYSVQAALLNNCAIAHFTGETEDNCVTSGTFASPECCDHQIKTFKRELKWDP